MDLEVCNLDQEAHKLDWEDRNLDKVVLRLELEVHKLE